jgi:hypothetical protein
MAYNEFAQEITETVGAKNYAELHITVSASNSIAGAGTYYKVNGTTAVDDSLNFSASGNNRLICDDLVTKKYLVIISLSASVSSGSVVASFGLNKNGTVDTSSVIKTTVGVASSIQSCSSSVIMTLAKDDYIEVILANNTNTQSLTVTNMNLTLIEI